MAERRDEELGAALRQLEVPDHGPDFYAQLRERLAEAANAPGEATTPAGAPGGVPARRARARPRRWSRPLLGVATAAAVAIAVLVANVALPSRTHGPRFLGPKVASAAEIRTHVAAALAGTRTLQGVLTVECTISIGECAPPVENGQARAVLRWSVAATASGDERVTGIGTGGDTSYRADQRTEVAIVDPALHALTPASVSTGLAAGPPDSARRSPLVRDYGSLVRTFLESGTDAPVVNTTVDGRPAWQLAVQVTPNKLAGPGRSPDRLEVVVDQASGFPLRVTATFAGQFLYQSQLSSLVIDAAVDPSVFVLNPPAGPKVFRHDYGFRAVALDQVAAVVGYQPVLPTDLPPGYHLAEITVARQAQATGNEGLDPPSRNVVSVAYRRGFDLIVVSTRSTGTDRSAWSDPLGTGEGVFDQPQKYSVAQGAMAGAAAEMVVTPGGTPHVWAIDARLVVTVSGDANRDELTRMMNSLR
ncbi:MAG: hypothetical protein QOG97_1906 [Acidimicrobiaceae bacterium]|nr:hypothetical protein [Acidimicrobiaceae bacterium]